MVKNIRSANFDAEQSDGFRADLHSADFRENIRNNYGAFIDSLPIIIYVVQPRPPYSPIYISQGIEMLGYTQEDWYQTADLWISIIHEDDREDVLRETAAAIREQREFDYEYRMYARDGSIFRFHDKGHFIRDSGGELLSWEGFLLDISARKTRQLKSNADSETVQPATTEKSTVKSILLVEDEEIVRELVRQILLSSDYEVTAAANGAEALEIFRSAGKSFDLVITDIKMPVMNGLELSEKIREINRHIKILFTSGYTQDTDFLKKIDDPARHFLGKPFLPQDLISKVGNILNGD